MLSVPTCAVAWDVQSNARTAPTNPVWMLHRTGFASLQIAPVGPGLSWELAVDAALEYMDRVRCGAIPDGVTCPADLMSMCVRNARRQR